MVLNATVGTLSLEETVIPVNFTRVKIVECSTHRLVGVNVRQVMVDFSVKRTAQITMLLAWTWQQLESVYLIMYTWKQIVRRHVIFV